MSTASHTSNRKDLLNKVSKEAIADILINDDKAIDKDDDPTNNVFKLLTEMKESNEKLIKAFNHFESENKAQKELISAIKTDCDNLKQDNVSLKNEMQIPDSNKYQSKP